MSSIRGPHSNHTVEERGWTDSVWKVCQIAFQNMFGIYICQNKAVKPGYMFFFLNILPVSTQFCCDNEKDVLFVPLVVMLGKLYYFLTICDNGRVVSFSPLVVTLGQLHYFPHPL